MTANTCLNPLPLIFTSNGILNTKYKQVKKGGGVNKEACWFC